MSLSRNSHRVYRSSEQLIVHGSTPAPSSSCMIGPCPAHPAGAVLSSLPPLLSTSSRRSIRRSRRRHRRRTIPRQHTPRDACASVLALFLGGAVHIPRTILTP